MKESLESEFNFDKVTYAQIKELSSLVVTGQKRDWSYIKERYERSASNFTDTLYFLLELELIEDENGILKSVPDEKVTDVELKSRVVNNLLNSSRRSLSDFNEYLDNFIENNGTYSFQPSLDVNLNTSGLRNLLIQLNFIEYDSSNKVYFVTEEWSKSLKGRHRELSAKGLSVILRNQEQLGKRAEEVIIEYERQVLKEHASLASMIEHVAIKNVSAGYDIKSFRPLERGYEERFIEVKAVSSDRDFYWSINEIQTAKRLGDKYHLYLLPVSGGGFDLEALITIVNPFADLYEQENVRTIECVSFHVTPDKKYLSGKSVLS